MDVINFETQFCVVNSVTGSPAKVEIPHRTYFDNSHNLQKIISRHYLSNMKSYLEFSQNIIVTRSDKFPRDQLVVPIMEKGKVICFEETLPTHSKQKSRIATAVNTNIVNSQVLLALNKVTNVSTSTTLMDQQFTKKARTLLQNSNKYTAHFCGNLAPTQTVSTCLRTLARKSPQHKIRVRNCSQNSPRTRKRYKSVHSCFKLL